MAEENEMPKKKGKHGGARPGAGRPSTDSKSVRIPTQVTLSAWKEPR